MFIISEQDSSGVVRFKREANALLASFSEQPDEQKRCESACEAALSFVNWSSTNNKYRFNASFVIDLLKCWDNDIPFTLIDVSREDNYVHNGDYYYHNRCTFVIKDDINSLPYDDEVLEYEARHWYSDELKEEFGAKHFIFPEKIYFTAGGVVTNKGFICKPYIKDKVYQPGEKIKIPVSYIKTKNGVIATMCKNEPVFEVLCSKYKIERFEDNEIPHYDVRKYKKLNK